MSRHSHTKLRRQTIVALTNAGRPFHWQDLLNVLCYPAGARVSFAYGAERLGSSIPRGAAQSPRFWHGRSLLIGYYCPLKARENELVDLSLDPVHRAEVDGVNTYRQWLRTTFSNDAFTFVPIRFATIRNAETTRQSVVLDLALEEFAVPRSKDPSDGWVEQLAKDFSAHLNSCEDVAKELPSPSVYPFGGPDPEGRTCLVHSVSTRDLFSKVIARAPERHRDICWRSIAKYLVNEVPQFEHATLMCMRSDRQTLTPSHPLPLSSSGRCEVVRYIARAGGRYQINVLLLCRTGRMPASPIIVASEAAVSVGKVINKQHWASTDALFTVTFAENVAVQHMPLLIRAEDSETLAAVTADPREVTRNGAAAASSIADDAASAEQKIVNALRRMTIEASSRREKLKSPMFVADVCVLPSTGRLAAALALISLGLIILALTPQQAEAIMVAAQVAWDHLHQHGVSSVDAWFVAWSALVQDLSYGWVLMKVIGIAVLSFGGLLGLKRGLSRVVGI